MMIERPTKESIAYHEAGHFVINSMLGQIPFTIYLEMKFPPPENIEINEDKGQGQVTGIGIPITNWTEESRIKIAGYLLNFPTFYINNKAMAVANILCAMAGFASDTSFKDTDRDNFGGIKGEQSDYGSFSQLIDYAIPGKFDGDNPERKKVIIQTTASLKKDLKEFFQLPEVSDAVHRVAESILSQEKDEEGFQRIEKKELMELDEMVQQLTLSRIEDLKSIIAKYAVDAKN